MNITIDSLPTSFGKRAEMPKAQRKRKPKKLGKLARKTLDRYRNAYRAVYGVYPEITVDGRWYRVKGISTGVTRMRLKEMAEQLEYRKGD